MTPSGWACSSSSTASPSTASTSTNPTAKNAKPPTAPTSPTAPTTNSVSTTSATQRGHNYAIVDEVDSVLIDDARTPLIISGPTGKDDEDQEFDRFKPVIEKLYNAQKNLVTKILADAKNGMAQNPDPKPEEEPAKLLLRAYRGLPKNKALIKFLSETGVKAILQRTENYYMQEQNKLMPIIDDELYFTIDEKNRTVDLTERGMDFLTALGEDRNFYQLPDIGSMIAELEHENLSPEEKAAKKEKIYSDFAIQSDRVHTVDQLLKAYTLFEKDIDYIVTEDRQVKIVVSSTKTARSRLSTSRPDVSWKGAAGATDSTRPSKPKKTPKSKPPPRPTPPSPSRTTSACTRNSPV